MTPRPATADAWVTVSRGALRHNVDAIRRLLARRPGPAPRLMAVVKANAYGHGAAGTAGVLAEAGVDWWAVTTPDEALELRAVGIGGRILVFLPLLPDQNEALVAAGCDVTVSDAAGVAALAQAAQAQGRVAAAHLKVDTGMGRLGVLPEAALELARRIAAGSGVRLAGVYTHFARALERDPSPTRRQFETFQMVLAGLAGAGITPELRHCAGSAALVRFGEMGLDAVRTGTLLYGQYPSAAVPRLLDLKETWRLQARVVLIRDVPPGTAVGYGGEYVTRRPARLAILPVGYADGLTVAPASAGRGWRGLPGLLKGMVQGGPLLSVTLRGRPAPVVGRVAMQTCTVDVSGIPDAAVGDVVTVPARRLTANARLPRLFEE